MSILSKDQLLIWVVNKSILMDRKVKRLTEALFIWRHAAAVITMVAIIMGFAPFTLQICKIINNL